MEELFKKVYRIEVSGSYDNVYLFRVWETPDAEELRFTGTSFQGIVDFLHTIFEEKSI